jgi:hypothetical protein
MSAIRDVWADLVDKRLWPLAVVLVIALVALPVLVLKPASSAAPPPPAAVTADAGAAVPQPAALVTDPAAIAEARSGGPVDGKFKNPFAQQHVPKPKPQPKAAATAATSSATATPVSSSGTSSSGGSTGTTPAPAAKPKPHVQVTKLKVRFGPSSGKRPVRELAPGTPVPSVNDPLLVFVDVDSHGKAEFVVASEVQPQGDGRCTPSRAICAQLFLKFGDTEFLDVTRPTGTVQFQLDVLGVVTR